MNVCYGYETNWIMFSTEEDYVKVGDLRRINDGRVMNDTLNYVSEQEYFKLFGVACRQDYILVYANEVMHHRWPRKNRVWWKRYEPKKEEK